MRRAGAVRGRTFEMLVLDARVREHHERVLGVFERQQDGLLVARQRALRVGVGRGYPRTHPTDVQE